MRVQNEAGISREELEKMINVAAGREPADLMVKNCNIVDVFNRTTFRGDVLVSGSRIAGFGGEGFPAALKVVDANGSYLVPGLVNGHVHIESSHCSPEEYARMVVPCGTTTAVCDPHEICNVCGLDGLDYMLEASRNLPADLFFMFPSCVPATPFEHAGDVLLADSVRKRIDDPRILGLGELMNLPGVVLCDKDVIDKVMVCKEAGKHIDGHSPSATGSQLDAYCSSLVVNDHECETPEELVEKVRKGMYVMLREGSACKNLLKLLKGVTQYNMDRCLFCTDDRQPKSILEEGDIDNNVRLAIQGGLEPIDAIRMATINGALCHRLHDRGAIAPGYKADFLIVDDLRQFRPRMVFHNGTAVAENGKYLFKSSASDASKVSGRMLVAPLSLESFALHLKSSKVRCIDVIPGGVVTGEFIADVKRDEEGRWIHDPKQDIVKIAVIERHRKTGFMYRCLIHNYGLRNGAIATTIAHDSHNLIIIGDNDDDMLAAARHLIEIGGGIAMVRDGKTLDSLPLPIAGLMTQSSGEDVERKLTQMHRTAIELLHVNKEIDPFMTLSFMALPVIPKLKITDSGLFDYDEFKFVPLEVQTALNHQ